MEESQQASETTSEKNVQDVASVSEDTRTSEIDVASEEGTEIGHNVEVVDDFIRNFCARNGMHVTLSAFQNEWHDLTQKGTITAARRTQIPDQYTLNAALECEIERLERKLEDSRIVLENEISNGKKLRKERDAHRLHHKRIAQEKNALMEEIKRLKAQCDAYEPRLSETRRKYEQQLKEKTMISLEKEKLYKQLEALQQMEAKSEEVHETKQKSDADQKRVSAFSKCREKEPIGGTAYGPIPVSTFNSNKTFTGHNLPVSNLALHPSKPIAASASDDHTWKLWHLTDCLLIMTGEGHSDWISGIDFHPQGRGLATGSGDGTVKLWDFQKQKCVKTLNENQAVWSVKYHESGELLATASLDHVARLWDLITDKCKTVLRGHADSVNEIVWQPHCHNLCTASSDKTVSLWDARSGLCNATFYGHKNSCNHCSFSSDGTMLASCDADGITKTWDIRSMREICSISTSSTANQCIFDKSHKVLLIACGDGHVQAFHPYSGESIRSFIAHDGSTLALQCDLSNSGLLTCGSDGSIKFWFAEDNPA